MTISTFQANTSTGSNYTLNLQVEEVESNIAANTSKLKYRAYLVGNNNTSAYSGYSDGLTMTLTVGDSDSATRYGNKSRSTYMDFGAGGVTQKTYYCNPTGTNGSHTASAMMGSSD